MALSENKPSDDKPGQPKAEELKPASSPSSSSRSADGNDVGGSTKIEKPSYGGEYARKINSPQLNNQINVYGEGPGEVPEANEEVRKINEKNSGILTTAAASGDADVHNLLGQRQIAEQNGDVDELKRIDDALAEGQQQTSR